MGCGVGGDPTVSKGEAPWYRGKEDLITAGIVVVGLIGLIAYYKPSKEQIEIRQKQEQSTKSSIDSLLKTVDITGVVDWNKDGISDLLARSKDRNTKYAIVTYNPDSSRTYPVKKYPKVIVTWQKSYYKKLREKGLLK